jgi:hypothetical protein
MRVLSNNTHYRNNLKHKGSFCLPNSALVWQGSALTKIVKTKPQFQALSEEAVLSALADPSPENPIAWKLPA